MTGVQIFWIVVTIEVVMAVWLRIAPAITTSKQDAWLSMLVGGFMGIGVTFLAVRVSMLHPGQSLAIFSQKLLGKWLGRLIVLPYVAAWYLLAANVLRTFGDFVHLILLDKTPVWMIMLLMTILMTYITYYCGIQGIARFCEIVGPIIILTLVISFILNVRNVEWKQIFPIYFDSGWSQILQGSYAPASFFAESFMLLVIVSYMQNPKHALSRSMYSMGAVIFMVIAATFMVLLVFGPNVAAKLRFPFFMLVRSIDILNFIQNLDIFVIFIWVFGVYAKLSFYLCITSSELANCIHVKDWRKVIWVGAPMIFIISCFIPNESTIEFLHELWRILVIPLCGVGIPLLLWIITAVQKKTVQ
ncbi:endospore germination permease [Paenibacillus sp. GD4]|uniref:GerAB/ArcD/ProY family transporter n=1 Tax=Paenibacillus sp. GD4 TaxID=3068890 RepID=UPI0027964282|nr:endospore germination permease [Paenibacillus sp. GD4]MDQ1914057.1 endospore germination permease [Paenibacillus sp. GD4]